MESFNFFLISFKVIITYETKLLLTYFAMVYIGDLLSVADWAVGVTLPKRVIVNANGRTTED